MSELVCQWMRAKTMQKIVNTLKGPHNKTSRELVVLFREFGFSFFPPKGK